MDDEGRLPFERELRQRLEALGPAARVELLRLLQLPRKDRATQIGKLYQEQQSRTMAELLVDLEGDPPAKAIVTTELRIMNRQDDAD